MQTCRAFSPGLLQPWAQGTLDGRVADAVSLLTSVREQSIAMGRAHYETLCSLPPGEAQMLGGCLVEAHALAGRAPGARPRPPGAGQ